MRTLLTAVCLVALAGCAADCGPDWYGIGQRDGVLGATPQEDYYAGRCKVEVDAVRRTVESPEWPLACATGRGVRTYDLAR